MKKNIVKKFGQFVKENYDMPDNSFNIGDLVSVKTFGLKDDAIVNEFVTGMIISDAINISGSIRYEVYFINEIDNKVLVKKEELEELTQSTTFSQAEKISNIESYQNIAKKLGIKLNTRYEDYQD